MTENDLTDAQWAAQVAIGALQQGRIELGYQLAKIAAHAERYERANSARDQLFGAPDSPDVSQPVPYLPAYTFDRVAENHPIDVAGVPTADPGPDLEQQQPPVDPAETAIGHAPVVDPEPRPGPPPTATCSATAIRDGVPVECHRGIYLQEPVGGPKQWVHIDPRLDTYHPALGR